MLCGPTGDSDEKHKKLPQTCGYTGHAWLRVLGRNEGSRLTRSQISFFLFLSPSFRFLCTLVPHLLHRQRWTAETVPLGWHSVATSQHQWIELIRKLGALGMSLWNNLWLSCTCKTLSIYFFLRAAPSVQSYCLLLNGYKHCWTAS